MDLCIEKKPWAEKIRKGILKCIYELIEVLDLEFT